MQPGVMPVDALALGGVILDHHLFLIPKSTLDKTHLAPMRATMRQGH